MKNMKTLLLLSTSLLFVSCIKETKTVSKESNNGSVPDCYYSNSCVPNSGGGTTTTGSGGGSSSNWGELYPNGVPTGTCSAPTGTGYDTRKAYLTSSGKFPFYVPTNPETLNYVSTDHQLKTENGAKTLFSSDAIVKVRFKAIPEPKSSNTNQTLCYGRDGGSTSLGYTKIKIFASIIGIQGNQRISHVVHPQGIEIPVNSCTPAIDLSPYKAMYPEGVYIQINETQVDDGPGTAYSVYGVPKSKCWSLLFEIATDTTKTFN